VLPAGVLDDAVAAVHGAAVVGLIGGGLLALRRPKWFLVHAPMALTMLAINLAGADCPLTTLELALRADAGEPPYEGGFLGHYVFGPLGLDVRDARSQLGLYLTTVTPNVLAYGLLATRLMRSAGAAAPTRRSHDRSPGSPASAER
jgi:hypothetical protein